MTEVAAESELARFDAARVASLEWKQTRRGRREWDLIADGARVATLVWRGPWRGGWTARTANDAWRIRHGFFGRCHVTREGDDLPVADSRRSGFLAVTIRRGDGEPLRWRRTGFFRPEHRLENREGFALFTERVRRGLLRREGAIVLEEAGRVLPDLLPLLFLTWALLQLEARAHGH